MNYSIKDQTQHLPQIGNPNIRWVGMERNKPNTKYTWFHRGISAARKNGATGRDEYTSWGLLPLSNWVHSQLSQAEPSLSNPLCLTYTPLCTSSLPTEMLNSEQEAQISHTNPPKTSSRNNTVDTTPKGLLRINTIMLFTFELERSPNDSCFSIWLFALGKSASLFLLTKSPCSSSHCDTYELTEIGGKNWP